jgi:2-phospho-L-lactate guanylyltransferase
LYIVIPCKKFDAGKSRLSTCLSAQARRSLCEEFFCKTVELASLIVPPSHILVTTTDPDAARIAKIRGVRLAPDHGSGLNDSLNKARKVLLASGDDIDSLTILPIDLPFLCRDVVERACNLPAEVTVAPDQSGTGTNLLILKGTAIQKMTFSFENDSCAAHLSCARRLGFSTCTFDDWRTALDIDGPSQFSEWLSYNGAFSEASRAS